MGAKQSRAKQLGSEGRGAGEGGRVCTRGKNCTLKINEKGNCGIRKDCPGGGGVWKGNQTID